MATRNLTRATVITLATPLIFWLMATPLAQPLAALISPLCLLRATLPTRYMPWLHTTTHRNPA